MTDLTLSIIIPTYNRLPLLKEALDSFVGLLDCSYEVIIVDDGSTDGTVEFLRALQEPYRVFFQGHKGGNAARNWGLREAHGRYVKFLDDDDWLIARTVSGQVRFLDVHADVDICYSDYGLVLDSGDIQLFNKTFNTALENILSGENRHKVGFPNFAYTLRAEKISEIHWDEDLSTAQDLDYFLRILLKGLKFGYLPGCIGWVRSGFKHYRVSVVSGERRREALVNYMTVLHMVEKTLTEKGELTVPVREALAQRHFHMALNFYRLDRDRETFRENMKKVLSLDPYFRPASGRRFRLLANLLGIEGAVWLNEVLRSVKAVKRHF